MTSSLLRTGRIVFLLLAGWVILAGCVTEPARRDVSVPTIAEPRSAGEDVDSNDVVVDETADADAAPAGLQRLDPIRRSRSALTQEDWSSRFPAGDALRVAVEDMPLAQFIHYAFGELLGVNYVIADGISDLEDPVSLNLQESVSSRRLYSLSAELLAGRNVGVTYRDDIFYLYPMDRDGNGDVILGFGARRDDVPDRPGPILQIIPLQYGLSPSIERTIRDLVDATVRFGEAFVLGAKVALGVPFVDDVDPGHGGAW